LASHKVCVFCGRDDQKLTNEHIYGNWMKDVLPTHLWLRGFAAIYHDENGQAFAKHQLVKQPRHQLQINKVCEPCNRRLDELVETPTRLISTPMLKGKARALDVEAMTTLATWALKAAICREYLDHERTRTVPASVRHAVVTNGLPTGNVRIYAARLGLLSEHPLRDRHRSFILPPGPSLGLKANSHLSSFSFWRLAYFVIGTASTTKLTDPPNAHSHLIRLWPNPSASRWPPPVDLEDEHYLHLSGAVGDFVDQRGRQAVLG